MTDDDYDDDKGHFWREPAMKHFFMHLRAHIGISNVYEWIVVRIQFKMIEIEYG